jgi:hypothetical protein
LNRSLSTETLFDCFRVFAHGFVGEADEDRKSDTLKSRAITCSIKGTKEAADTDKTSASQHS